MSDDLDFIKALQSDSLVSSIFENNGFSKLDFLLYDYRELWDNNYEIYNLSIGRWKFDVVNMSLVTNHLFFILKKFDSAFAIELPNILGKGFTYEKNLPPNEPSLMRTKLPKINIAGKSVHASYLISDYGSEIRLFMPLDDIIL